MRTVKLTASLAALLCRQDIGWKPFVESWASTREDASERQILPSLFEKYIEATRAIVRKGFKEVTPLRVLNKVRSLLGTLRWCSCGLLLCSEEESEGREASGHHGARPPLVTSIS